MSGETRIRPREEVRPIKIDAATPWAVAFFQNRIIRIAGRLAEAATAKAQPTRKEAFIPSKIMPMMMAMMPTHYGILPICLMTKGDDHERS